ncbi:MAG: glycosyltransferase family 2 protein [Nitrospirae bacterium]|nr:glycosyltransferase family 2 protein [Nitrospirota bacterium]
MKAERSRILVIIPALNEEKNIAQVVSSINKEVPYADILVVNDGSRDRTGQIAREHGATVIDLPYNLGIGGAMQAGFRFARLYDYDIAIQVDGDGQHPADHIERLVQVIAEGKSDMASGSRFVANGGYKSTRSRLVGIKYFSLLLSLILRERITDTTSGFRAVNKKVIDLFSRNYPDDYPEVEALVLLHKRGLRVKEIPVEMKERAGGKSSITPFRSMYYMVKVSLAVLIEMIRKAER